MGPEGDITTHSLQINHSLVTRIKAFKGKGHLCGMYNYYYYFTVTGIGGNTWSFVGWHWQVIVLQVIRAELDIRCSKQINHSLVTRIKG